MRFRVLSLVLLMLVLQIIVWSSPVVVESAHAVSLFEECCYYSGLSGCCFVVALDYYWDFQGDWPGW